MRHRFAALALLAGVEPGELTDVLEYLVET
jgi:hypothetical protein